ncbi:MAG: hypothetical protein V1725_05775 [archaeon]
MRYAALLAIFVLLLFPLAYARIDVVLYGVSTDFSIAMEGSNPTVCSCTSYQDTLLVTNTGTYPSVFSVNVDNDVFVSERTFELQPGKSKLVQLTIRGECGQQKTLDYHVIVASSTGKTKMLERKAVIKQCQNLLFNIAPVQDYVLPCSPITFEATLQNTGSFPEEYMLTSNHDDARTTPAEPISLPPNQSRTFQIAYAFDCKTYGETQFTFTAKAQKNKLQTTKDINITIEDQYGYDLSHDGTFAVCLNQENTYTIDMHNPLHFANDFSFTLEQDAPTQNGFYLDHTALHLEPGETQHVAVKVHPEDSRDVGGHELTMHIASLNKEQALPLHAQISNCYNPRVDILSERITACPGTYELPVLIRNDGSFSETVKLTLQGPTFAELTKEQVILDSGEEKNTTLIVDTEDQPQLEGDYTLRVNASLENGFWTSDTLDVQLLSEHACRQLSIKGNLIRIGYDPSQKSVMLTNGPYRTATYDLSLDGPAWASMNETTITLSPNEEKEVLLFFSPNGTEGMYDVKVHAQSDAYSYDLPVKVRLARQPFLIRAYQYLVLHPCMLFNVLLLVIACLFVLRLCTMKKIRLTKKFKKENRLYFKTFWIVLVVFVLLSAFLAIFMVKIHLQYPSLPETDSLHIAWYENQYKTLSLNDYFYSPENSRLTYSSSATDHITASIDRDAAKLIPERNWHGKQTITFTATDVVSESTSSTDFLLEVVEVPSPTFLQRITAYCEWTNLSLFMIILLSIYLLWLLRVR